MPDLDPIKLLYHIFIANEFVLYSFKLDINGILILRFSE